MRVIYCRSRNLGSLLIRRAIWSSWSHEGIVTPEGTVIDARMAYGVCERPIDELLAEVSKWAYREWPVPDERAALAWARAQVGKRYDYLGALGMGLRRDWGDPACLLCSEVVEGALQAGGRHRWAHHVERVTPQLSWMVACA